MKVLTLNDGTKLEVSDLSTFGDIINVFKTKAEAGAYWNNFTRESLTDAKLGDRKFTAVPISMKATIDEIRGNITAHYLNQVIESQAASTVVPDSAILEEEPAAEEAPAEEAVEEAPAEEAEAPAEEASEEVTEEAPEEETTEES